MNNYSNLTYNYQRPFDNAQYNNQGDRFIGGFAFPFLLGGVTGAALAPNFWRPGYGYNRPFYPPYAPYPPYPPYRPYYR